MTMMYTNYIPEVLEGRSPENRRAFENKCVAPYTLSPLSPLCSLSPVGLISLNCVVRNTSRARAPANDIDLPFIISPSWDDFGKCWQPTNS